MAWKYAAVVRAIFFDEVPTMLPGEPTHVSFATDPLWVLYSGYTGSSGGRSRMRPTHFRIKLSSEFLDTLIPKIVRKNNISSLSAEKHRLNEIIKKEILDELIRNGKELTDFHFVASSQLGLINMAAEEGWELSGELMMPMTPTSIYPIMLMKTSWQY